ncbi:putative Impact family protein [Histomonas meleagridis]|uniref:putative Impact family protein n=1 Tax=Histomonas meleagridis TaxID=135588 RepID=UPI003559B553|nr:putative Impact family protein [Histomonas meleagridis]KAH0803405.1 putative Impact family protein [Histomonas meleagridis]
MYSLDDPPEIFSGEPFVEKKSKFQAFCAACHNIQDVCLFRDTLLENPKIEGATHNILAYITPEEEGFDDDGETHAGTQVLQMMQLAGAKDCAVIVTRWYGGIQLHGDRFRIITAQALNVLKAHGFIKPKENQQQHPQKKCGKKKGK